jgi:hypothetical protein
MAGVLNINRSTLEVIAQKYRVPGVLPLAVEPTATSAATNTASFKVADQLVRIFPFSRVPGNFASYYQARLEEALVEPSISGAASSPSWQPGYLSQAFGQELVSKYSVGETPDSFRFHKASVFIRTDELMDGEVLDTQVRLASISIVRALSRAILQSRPMSATGLDDSLVPMPGLPYGCRLRG